MRQQRVDAIDRDGDGFVLTLGDHAAPIASTDVTQVERRADGLRLTLAGGDRLDVAGLEAGAAVRGSR